MKVIYYKYLAKYNKCFIFYQDWTQVGIEPMTWILTSEKLYQLYHLALFPLLLARAQVLDVKKGLMNMQRFFLHQLFFAGLRQVQLFCV